jgi:hypothetical protein
MSFRTTAIALAATALLVAPAFAQTTPATVGAAPSPALRAAILADLNAETRAEVTRRATGGNSQEEVLSTILLNNLQLADAPNARVVAIDFAREVAVLDVPGQNMRVVPFNRATLTVKR